MTAVITGTSSGIGKSTALLLIENNIEVIGFQERLLKYKILFLKNT